MLTIDAIFSKPSSPEALGNHGRRESAAVTATHLRIDLGYRVNSMDQRAHGIEENRADDLVEHADNSKPEPISVRAPHYTVAACEFSHRLGLLLGFDRA